MDDEAKVKTALTVMLVACVVMGLLVLASHPRPQTYVPIETTRITSDPTADYLIEPGQPLPPGAPGARQ